MKIKDLPTSEMPRERMLKYGVENLSNVDLLSILLRTGIKDMNVSELAISILNQIGGIQKLSTIGVRELSNIKGMGSVKAITILAAIELGNRVNAKEIDFNIPLTNGEVVFNSFKRFFINQTQEKFMAIYLDTKKRFIAYKIIAIGTLDRTLVHPRDIFHEAIKNAASSIILMHNHPSGVLLPSKEDEEFTRVIMECGKMMNIPIIDHIITNGREYYSYYDEHHQKD